MRRRLFRSRYAGYKGIVKADGSDTDRSTQGQVAERKRPFSASVSDYSYPGEKLVPNNAPLVARSPSLPQRPTRATTPTSKMALSVDQKRLMATKFPPEFNQKVDIQKVKIDLMKPWIATKITSILGSEDDVVVETCYNLLEQSQFVSMSI